jgi:hypothetical protein
MLAIPENIAPAARDANRGGTSIVFHQGEGQGGVRRGNAQEMGDELGISRYETPAFPASFLRFSQTMRNSFCHILRPPVLSFTSRNPFSA